MKSITRNIALKLSTLVCIILIISSCSSVYYENPQPAGQENLSEFPKKLIGTYVDVEKGDTIAIVSKEGFSINMNSNDVKIPLSEKTILRKYKNYYFLSLKQEADSTWTVYIVKPEKKKTFVLYDFANEESTIAQLKAITKVKKQTKSAGETPIPVINPSLEELDKILESGLLIPSLKMKK